MSRRHSPQQLRRLVWPRRIPSRIVPPAYRSNGPRNDDTISWRVSMLKLLEGSATAFGSVVVLGLAGYVYHVYYKSLVLSKMSSAFASGYSTLELAALGRHSVDSDEEEDAHWVPRPEQATIDQIVDGTLQGQYYLVTGEKGTGKTSMLLRAMKRANGEGAVLFEGHGDLEIFRLRLGKALNYEFHEDYIGGLFSFKGPRDTTPLLDIERAFNKMEKLALARREALGKPLVLIINGIHLIPDNDDGRNLLDLLQQRAELWAASHLVTVVLNSDEYWVTERLMGLATRMQVFPVHDIPRDLAIKSLRKFRAKGFGERVSSDVLNQVYDKIGGRLRFLVQVGKSPDMLRACDSIYDKEKRWFLSQCWILGETMDDDAEDHQEACAAAMLLAKALVDREDMMRERGDAEAHLPEIPLHEARQIMTRAEFIQHHDHKNIVTIDNRSMVKADSVAMQNVFREVCRQEGFEKHLQATLDRLDELESLRRTREIVFKSSDSSDD
ncbi:hypothetical protein G7054_g6140 [Neopestalotiopsis clavispora]|nr:hypothetical protein G7054_g6140 [Neopestalotiopsis clavispora]